MVIYYRGHFSRSMTITGALQNLHSIVCGVLDKSIDNCKHVKHYKVSLKARYMHMICYKLNEKYRKKCA